jgi:hypothetical protein
LGRHDDLPVNVKAAVFDCGKVGDLRIARVGYIVQSECIDCGRIHEEVKFSLTKAEQFELEVGSVPEDEQCCLKALGLCR